MSVKILGAALIIAGSGGVGFALSANYLRQERAMEQLLQCLQWMQSQLQYAMPPLSQLCYGASKVCTGPISLVMLRFSQALERQEQTDVSGCMHSVICHVPALPENAGAHLRQLGVTLGQFDLKGELSGLEAAIERCKQELDILRAGQEAHTRTYQTLGICAGAALVILLI